MQTHPLTAHPAHPPSRVTSIEARITGIDNEWLRLRWRIEGAQALVIPPFAGKGRADELWQTTCFELFLMPGQGPAYSEFNLSPSERWAAYDFSSYREGMAERPSDREPQTMIRQGSTFAIFDAAIPLTAVPAGECRMNFAAVIEEEGGTKSYWALAHPADKPDFHDPSCFAATPSGTRRRMKFGIDRLLAEPELRKALEGKRVALVAHPASVTADLVHSLDALIEAGINVASAFGPQHGLKGDKQDNMVETADETDPKLGIPVFSLYGEVRRPSGPMMSTADVFLFDLQDLGCRIYTFVTTLLYLLEAAAEHGKSVWVLDRPNPAGRPVEGTLLVPGQESFVGAAPMPMRHGLTMGEMGAWFVRRFGLDVDYRVIEMHDWLPEAAPGYGWPDSRVWINPSPNAANLNMARAYAGTVMLEGTTMSEGRGTTRPLEVLFGAPDIDAEEVLRTMERMAPDWLAGCAIRPCWFTPTFHKHAGELCSGLMIHAEGRFYRHQSFRPWRLQALAFKAVRALYPDYEIWRDFPYEYEFERLAIDVINGGPALREWVDDPAAQSGDLDALTAPDEAKWRDEVSGLLLY